jgi:hypothetical protein
MAATLRARWEGLEPAAADLAVIRDGRGPDRAWETACEQLLAVWEPTVKGMARHHAPRRADRPDFAQVARLALLRAARGYQHLPGRASRTTPAARFATRCSTRPAAPPTNAPMNADPAPQMPTTC